MIFKIIVALFVLFILSCVYTYVGYLIAEARFKHDMDKQKATIESLNEYVRFLQIELVSERRSKINVTVNDSKEETYEN